MTNLPQHVALPGQSNLGTQYIVSNPTTQTIYMPPATEQEISYTKGFNKKIVVTLSIIQLVNAAIIIVTYIIYYDDHYNRYKTFPGRDGFIFWCGIAFGTSGAVGVMASVCPGLCTIVTLMVVNIIAAVLLANIIYICPFLVEATSDTAMYYIYMSVSVVQYFSAILSSCMTCKATRWCCKPNRQYIQEGGVYYAHTGGRETNNLTLISHEFDQQQSGYMTTAIIQQSGSMVTPIIQIPIATTLQRAEALPNEDLIPRSNVLNAESPPPTYETITNYENLEGFERVHLEKGDDGTK
jgi:hypothetical protein